MAKSNNNLKTVLQDTANAIRSKKGTSNSIMPRDFADEISGITGEDTSIMEINFIYDVNNLTKAYHINISKIKFFIVNYSKMTRNNTAAITSDNSETLLSEFVAPSNTNKKYKFHFNSSLAMQSNYVLVVAFYDDNDNILPICEPLKSGDSQLSLTEKLKRYPGAYVKLTLDPDTSYFVAHDAYKAHCSLNSTYRTSDNQHTKNIYFYTIRAAFISDYIIYRTKRVNEYSLAYNGRTYRFPTHTGFLTTIKKDTNPEYHIAEIGAACTDDSDYEYTLIPNTWLLEKNKKFYVYNGNNPSSFQKSMYISSAIVFFTQINPYYSDSNYITSYFPYQNFINYTKIYGTGQGGTIYAFVWDNTVYDGETFDSNGGLNPTLEPYSLLSKNQTTTNMTVDYPAGFYSVLKGTRPGAGANQYFWDDEYSEITGIGKTCSLYFPVGCGIFYIYASAEVLVADSSEHDGVCSAEASVEIDTDDAINWQLSETHVLNDIEDPECDIYVEAFKKNVNGYNEPIIDVTIHAKTRDQIKDAAITAFEESGGSEMTWGYIEFYISISKEDDYDTFNCLWADETISYYEDLEQE